MIIFLKFVIGDTIALKWKSADCIYEIKSYLNWHINIDESHISLFFNGIETNDIKCLKDYGIVSQNSMILVVIKNEGMREISTKEIRKKINELRLKENNLESLYFDRFSQSIRNLYEASYNFVKVLEDSRKQMEKLATEIFIEAFYMNKIIVKTDEHTEYFKNRILKKELKEKLKKNKKQMKERRKNERAKMKYNSNLRNIKYSHQKYFR